MDDDLESELMDLATNESAYLPLAAHSRPPPIPQAPAATAPPSRTMSTPNQRCKSSLPATLATSFEAGGRQRPLQASTIAALPTVPSPSPPPIEMGPALSAGGGESLLDSGEEPTGWYDQIEMLLANAESLYYAWVDEMETQGSATEEEFRLAESQRIERRRLVVEDLKQTRRALVHAKLVESHHAATAASSHQSHAVDVDKMMDTLGAIVDESATQLARLRRDGMWTALAQNLSPVEHDYVAKGADEMFSEKMKYKRDQQETQEIVEQHLKAIFQWQRPSRKGQSVGRTMNHSLGQTLREFVDIFHTCYGDPAVHTALSERGSSAAATRLLPLVAADINAFGSILVQILHYKYPDLPRTWATPVLHRCVIDVLFEHLQPTLHALYVAAFADENAYLSGLCQQLRSSRLDRFGISPVFRLDGSWSPTPHGNTRMRDDNDLYLQSLRQYEPVIACMNALPTHRSPWVKAQLVAGLCKDLDQRVKDFYGQQAASGQPSPPPSQVSLSADDLSALLVFVVVASPAMYSHLATQLVLLGSYMESESGLGEEGFAVATLWTAVSHLCHLS